jgi:hypothetical protein
MRGGFPQNQGSRLASAGHGQAPALTGNGFEQARAWEGGPQGVAAGSRRTLAACWTCRRSQVIVVRRCLHPEIPQVDRIMSGRLQRVAQERLRSGAAVGLLFLLRAGVADLDRALIREMRRRVIPRWPRPRLAGDRGNSGKVSAGAGQGSCRTALDCAGRYLRGAVRLGAARCRGLSPQA